MYAKFRTVASILVIAEFTIPLLAMLALKKIVEDPTILTKNIKALAASWALTAGIALLFALMPSVFFSSFVSTSEMHALQSGIPQEYLGPLISNLTEMRQAMFTSDCWRSFFLITIGTFFLLLYRYNKIKSEYLVGILLVMCLLDMWMVNKRYLNDAMFVDKTERDAPQPKTKTDDFILQDTSDCGHYRVLNLA